MSKTLLFNEDNIKRLRKLPADSIHACVTDPPYGLTNDLDINKMLSDWLDYGKSKPKSKKGFMGKEWDNSVPQPELWKEVLRVLKPGAYCLAFFSARTYDLGVLSMRLAGFDIKDCIVWHYAQGFPKSVNVSKGIDKKLGKKRKVVGKRSHPTLKDKSKVNRQGKQQFHGTNSIKDEWDITAAESEEAKKWDGWGSALKPASEYIVIAQKAFDGTIVENVLRNGTGAFNIEASRVGFDSNDDSRIGKGYTHKAMAGISPGQGKKYNEDGTENSLYKDNGRYPANVILSHSPECRLVGKKVEKGKQLTAGNRTVSDKKGWGIGQGGCSYKKGTGAKFAPDIVSKQYKCVDGCPIKTMNEQSGDRSSARIGNDNNPKRGGSTKPQWGMSDGRETKDYRDSGGAARFFYCSKVSRSERNAGLESLSNKHLKQSNQNMIGLKNNTNTSNGKKRNPNLVTKNHHPTVKPVALMEYLVRMVTKPNGIVLDPFMGSGTTGVACMKEGFRFIGIERETDYFEIADKRIAFAKKRILQKLF